MNARLTTIVMILMLFGIGSAYAQDQGAGTEAKPTVKNNGTTDQMMSCCHKTMSASIGSHNPDTLLGMKDQLKLTDQQVKRLEAVAQKAKHAAMAVLTDAQRKQIKQMPHQAQSMSRMCERMTDPMKKMKGKNGMNRGMGEMQGMKGMEHKNGADDKCMACMKKMRGKKTAQGTNCMDLCCMAMCSKMMPHKELHRGMGKMQGMKMDHKDVNHPSHHEGSQP